MKPEALIILTPGFPADEHDSTCLPSQQNLVLAMKAACPSLEIIIVSFQYPFHSRTYRWHGIRVIAFGGRNRPKLYRAWLWRRVWRQLNLLHQQMELIGILSFWYGECAVLARRFCTQHQLVHRCWLLGQDARAGNRFVKWGLPAAEELVAISDAVRDNFERNYNLRPAHVITNGINPAQFGDGSVPRDISILAAGSLIPLKRFDQLVSVTAGLMPKFPGLRVVIAGAGPELHRLQAISRKAGLDEHISFMGEISHEALLLLMQRARLFVHPSSYEGFSTVCLEALYAGAQVLSFCTPMHEDIQGWASVSDEAALLRAAEAILRNYNLPDLSAFRFTIDRTAADMLAMFGVERFADC